MSAQCCDQLGGNRATKIDRHRCIEPIDMDGAVEAIVETRRDMAAQKALGHFVVVPHPGDRAISQRRLGRELDHRLLDFQTWAPSRKGNMAGISSTITSATDGSFVATSTKRLTPRVPAARVVHGAWRVRQKFT